MNALPGSLPAMPGALAGLKVVEFGEGTAAPYAAKLLADFGADVVKVEGPAGDCSRRRGPFPDGIADPEASGLFLYLNTNKKGVVIDVTDGAGLKAFHGLLADADIFVTNQPAPMLEAAGLAPETLRVAYPRLVIASISPFGTDGPWAHRRGDEIIACAMGGIAYATPGMPEAAADPEREPPLRANAFVAQTIAGSVAAMTILSAVFARLHTHEGCHIELSEHATVAALQLRDISTFSYVGGTYNRLLNAVTIGRMPNFYLPCKDGYVAIVAPLDTHWDRLVEGMGRPAWALTPDFATSAARFENWEALRLHLMEWTMTQTGADIYELGIRRQLPLFRFYRLRETLASEHVQARDSVADITVGGRPAKMPAAPVLMGRTPWQLRRPAPRLGEHTRELLGARGEAHP